MPPTRKRRAPPQEAETQEDSAPPEPALTPLPSDNEDASPPNPSTLSTAHQQMVKDLVRLALASEYSRTLIRRADISAKVLTPAGSGARDFRAVFDDAQLALRQVFGVEMAELPGREKTSVRERRAAMKSQSQSQGKAGGKGSAMWVLRSVLPERFRGPEVLAPPKCPTGEAEAAYIGLYSLVVAVVVLSGGVLAEGKLERYLRRMNAEVSVPGGKTAEVLQRMCKDGYLVRQRETVAGEEVVEYHVGPRGKVEVGERGVEGLVRAVYGPGSLGQEELDRRLERSLNVGGVRVQVSGEGQVRGANSNGAARKGRSQPKRTQAQEADESDDNNDEEEDSDG